MHGYISEWVWDYYGPYTADSQTNSAGSVSGTHRVYRGGGRLGQSITAIAKLAPKAAMGEALSIHYSGESTRAGDIAGWLDKNNIHKKQN